MCNKMDKKLKNGKISKKKFEVLKKRQKPEIQC